MKKLFILALLYYVSFNTMAQVEEFVEIPGGGPVGLAVKDDYLYIGNVAQSKIQKVNLTQTPVVEDFVDPPSNSFPGLLKIKDNKLYVPTIVGIGEVDLVESNPSFDIITFPRNTFGTASNNNYIYATERTGFVWKFDLSQSNPLFGEEMTIVNPDNTLAILGSINGLAMIIKF